MIVMPPVFNSGDTIYFFFDSYDSNGASVTISGLAVTDIEVYKNGSITQRSSDNGYALLDTDGIDFDGATGLHGFSIDTSDNSDAGFWADGAQYLVHVNAVTIDSQTVRFSYLLTLGYLLRPTTAGRKLTVESDGMGHADLKEWLGTAPLALSSQQVQAIVPDTQKVDLNTIKTQAVTCAAGVTVLASVGTAATSTAQTGDAYGIVNSGTHGNAALKTLIDTVDTVADGVKAKTDSLTFSVSGQLDANVQYVNNVQVGGTGTEVDPWGPA